MSSVHFSPGDWASCRYHLCHASSGEDITRKIGWQENCHPHWIIDVGIGAPGWCRVKGEAFRRPRSSVVLYAPDVVYEENFEPGGLHSWAYIALQHTGGRQSPLKSLTGRKGFAVFEDPLEQVRSDIRAIGEIARRRLAGFQFSIASRVNSIVAFLLDAGARPVPSGTDPPDVRGEWVHAWKRTAILEMEKSFPSPLTVDHLALRLGVARSTVSHKYRAYCGESFVKTVHRWRLEKARVLLQRPDLSIKEIARLVGLSQPSYLTAFLKRNTGHTPSELRRMSRKSA